MRYVIFLILAIYFWKWVLAGTVLYVTYALLSEWYWSNNDKRAAQREAERQRVARLIHNANVEDKLVQEGDMAGVYGDYKPPVETRGMGIRLGGS